MAQKYSDQVLEETPARAAKFLSGIGAVSIIRTLMHGGGMMDEDMAEGGKLLLDCWAQLPQAKAETDTEEAKAQRAATAELDQWDEPNFARYSAALNRRFPSAAAYVFHQLAASTGEAAVAGVGTFLKRIEALEKGLDPARHGSRKEDKKAVEMLAGRGLHKEERSRLTKLVETALRPTSTLTDTPQHEEERAANRKAALTALKDWFEEWATTARAVVKKRAYLIRMGLASRKVTKGKKATPSTPT